MFEDLAQEAIGTCRQSLTAASQALMAKKDKEMDGRLFLVRHLLILKEMTAGLDLGRRSGRRDWGGVTGTYPILVRFPLLNSKSLVLALLTDQTSSDPCSKMPATCWGTGKAVPNPA